MGPYASGREDARGAGPSPGRALALLCAANAIGGLGLAAGGTSGVLLAVELAGTPSAAGLPVLLHLTGAALGALLVSRQAAIGRRSRGLALGFALGALGAVLVVCAAGAGSLPGVLAGSTVLGCANSSVFLTRYAAADAAGEKDRGKALGAVFLATAVGAVLSPLLLGPSGTAAEALGLPALAGLYLVAAVVFSCSALLLTAALPRPRTDRAPVPAAGPRARGTGIEALRGPRGAAARAALLALAGANFVMVGVMTLAPLQLTEHGHSHELVGTFVALHVLAMFGPSPVTGRVADRWGPVAVVQVGGALLLASSVSGALPGSSGPTRVLVQLMLAGLGWNCAVVGGSTLLVRAVPDQWRPHTEGLGEVAMGAAAATAAPLVGVLPAAAASLLLSICSAATPLLSAGQPHRPPEPSETRSRT